MATVALPKIIVLPKTVRLTTGNGEQLMLYLGLPDLADRRVKLSRVLDDEKSVSNINETIYIDINKEDAHRHEYQGQIVGNRTRQIERGRLRGWDGADLSGQWIRRLLLNRNCPLQFDRSLLILDTVRLLRRDGRLLCPRQLPVSIRFLVGQSPKIMIISK